MEDEWYSGNDATADAGASHGVGTMAGGAYGESFTSPALRNNPTHPNIRLTPPGVSVLLRCATLGISRRSGRSLSHTYREPGHIFVHEGQISVYGGNAESLLLAVHHTRSRIERDLSSDSLRLERSAMVAADLRKLIASDIRMRVGQTPVKKLCVLAWRIRAIRVAYPFQWNAL